MQKHMQKICKNMQNICKICKIYAKYAKLCKICNFNLRTDKDNCTISFLFESYI